MKFHVITTSILGSVLRSATARRGPESRDVLLLRHSQSADIPGRPACQQRGRGQSPLHLRLHPRLLLRHGFQPLVGPPHLHLVSLRRYLKFQLFYFQGCGSGTNPDPDSIGSVDPDSESGSGFVSRRAKNTHEWGKKLKNFMFWSVGWPLLRAEGFFSMLDVLNGGLGIGKL